MATFGSRMREIRRSKGLTLEDLSEKLKTTKATLSRYENDKRAPDIHIAKEIADVLGVDLNFLAYEESQKPEKEVNTIAGHIDSDELTEEDLQLIEDFKKLVLKRKKNKKDDKN